MLRCAARQRVVLAVSGGRDSMALLHAAARVLEPGATLVATFDHATGAAATRAANHVLREAARLGFGAVIGRAARNAGSEAGWREARHAFLREVARSFGGRVMTAHTRDDQVETVLMRVLRGAGARGIAALHARGQVLRPFLGFTRDDVAAYAVAAGARWVEDPTNQSPVFLRNRVRRDLLPALRRVDPGFDDALLDASRRAATVRRGVERIAAALTSREAGRVRVPSSIARHDESALRLLWPAIAATAGLAMDRRGTGRAAAFTRKGRVGGRIPLTGGWVITRGRDHFVLCAETPPAGETTLVPGLEFQEWRFRATRERPEASDAWVALLPENALLRVRAWRPGDRLRSEGPLRRVKRYLSDAGITGEQRARWPVVLVEDEIVWIPGVRRSDAAAVRPGRSGVLYRCDFDRH